MKRGVSIFRFQATETPTHLEQNLALELGRARQLLHLALQLVHPLRHQSLSERRLHDLDKLVLLLDGAVNLHAQQNRIRRGEEGVLSDRLEDLAYGDLGGESEAVSDDRKPVVAIPYVDCEHEDRLVSLAPTRAVGKGDEQLTLHATTALLERSDVAFYGALALELVADQIRLREQEGQLPLPPLALSLQLHLRCDSS